MQKIIHPLLLLIAQATEKEATKYIEYLKAENKILRSKLPKQIQVTESERATLVKLGEAVGSAIKELISIVHPRTFARWLSEKKAGKDKEKKPRGRPRKPEEVRQLVVDFAKDSGWGFRRIWGELKRLGIKCMSRSTVARVLKENGFDPGPKRGTGTWNEFVQRHIKTLWATDFFTKTVMTLYGPVTYYVLFFIHVHSRRVHLAGFTQHPDGEWMSKMARNMSMIFAEEPIHSAASARSFPPGLLLAFGVVPAAAAKPATSILSPIPMLPKTAPIQARVAEFERMRKDAAAKGITMLPVEQIADDLFFRDDRLGEYRNVDNPCDTFPSRPRT